MISLCAGISHGNVRLLLKYSFRGVTKAKWQSRPIPQGLFGVVAHVLFSIRRCLPEAYRSMFPNCFRLMLYRAGQCAGWHQDGTPCPNKSIVDESPVLTTRCRPTQGPSAEMAFHVGTVSDNPTVLHEFELERGDVFLVGPESNHAMAHRTQPHDESDTACFTILSR